MPQIKATLFLLLKQIKPRCGLILELEIMEISTQCCVLGNYGLLFLIAPWDNTLQAMIREEKADHAYQKV